MATGMWGDSIDAGFRGVECVGFLIFPEIHISVSGKGRFFLEFSVIETLPAKKC